MLSKALTIAAVAVLWAPGLIAADVSPIGRWQTLDVDTGTPSGQIEIVQSGDELIGRVVRIYPKPGDPPDPVCKKCEGPEKDQRVMGMIVMKGFKRDGDEWDGGTILDPRTGNVYSSELRLDEGGRKLKVRGYIGISLLGRTQTWDRED